MILLKTIFSESALSLLTTSWTVLMLTVGYAKPTLADSIVSGTDGTTGSVVTVEGNRYTITGGRYSGDRNNLFHELEQLNLSPDEIADFISASDINNIVTLVTGENASYLNGLIQVSGGNSNLYLINPAGVLFGESAILNLPTNLTVTTADRIGFGDQWLSVFEPSSYTAFVGDPNSFDFTAPRPGTILNEGDLSLSEGAQLILLGGTVINTGTLSTADGSVTVASVPGEQLVRVSQAGNLISLELTATDGSMALVSAEEAMPFSPLSIPELLTGGNATHVSDITVNADGTIQLGNSETAVSTDAGTSLVAGGIETVGETGGSITVLGDRVGLLGAALNASGNSGGGTIRVGGDYQGQGSVFRARRTFVDERSELAADALINGNGGQVTLWADGATKFDGIISAQGGVQSGDGGLVETSGLTFLDFQGQVNTSSARGQVGSLLLDPTNIEVVAAGGTATSLADVDNFLDADLGPGLATTIDASLLNTALSNITLQAVNDITFNADVNIVAPDVGLTADAGNNIAVNTAIRTNGGDVVLSANSGSLTVGNIATSADGSVANRNAGDIALAAGGNVLAGSLFARAVDGNGGNISVQSNTGDISIAAIATFAVGEVRNGISTEAGNAGSVSLAATTGNITLTDSFGIQSRALAPAAVATGNGGAVNIAAGGAVSIGGEIDTRSQATVSGANARSGRGGDITVEAAESISINGRLISLSLADNGSTLISPAGEAGNITLRSAGDVDLRSGSVEATPQSINATSPIRAGTVLIDAQGDIRFIGEDSRPNSNDIRAGELIFRAGGGINLNLGLPDAELLTTGQNVTFVANESIQLQNAFLNTGAVGGDDGGDVFIQSRLGNISIPAVSTSTLGQNQNGISTNAGAAGTVTLDAPTGNIFVTAIDGIRTQSVAGGDAISNPVSVGTGGRVDISAGGVVSIEGPTDTRSQALGNIPNSRASRGGDITINAAGDISTGRLFSLSFADSSPADAAGDITINAENGSVNIISRAIPGTPSSINAISSVERGELFIAAGGDINIIGEDDSIGANSIRAGRVFFRAGDNITLNLGAENSFVATGGQTATFIASQDIRFQQAPLFTGGSLPPVGTSAVSGDVAFLSSSGGVFVDNLIATNSSLGDSGNVTIEALSEIQANSIVTASFVGNAGNVLLDPIGDIQLSSINATAVNGLGGTVDATAGRYFRATGSFVDFNGTAASISTTGVLGGGSITLRQGGGGLVPFLVGDGSLNGAQAALTTGGNTLLPPQTLLGPFTQGNIQIVTTPSQEPIPEIEDAVAVLDDLDNLVSDSNNPEVIATPSTVPITYDEPDKIRETVSLLETGFDQQYRKHYGRDGEGRDGEGNEPSSEEDTTTDNDNEGAVTASETELAEEDVIENTQQTIQKLEAATEGVKPAVMYVFFAPGDTFFPDDDGLLSLDGNLVGEGEEQAYRSPLPVSEQATGCKGRENYQLFLVLVTSSEEPVAKQMPGVTCTEVVDTALKFRKDMKLLNDDYLQASQQLYQWLIAPLSNELGIEDNTEQTEGLASTVNTPGPEKITNLVFIMDQGLRSLPLAALHDGEQFLIEKEVSLGLMPSVSLTKPTYQNVQNSEILSLGISDFSAVPSAANLSKLPAVPFELENISGDALVVQVTLPEDEATIGNLQEERRRSSAEIVHLATHADFRRGRPEESYIQFWDEPLRLSDVRRMGWGDPAVELLVLSACETASDSYEAELGFAGFAHQAGVNSILASLWNVSDIGTAGLMTEFYAKLRTAPIKAEALRQAQLAMLNKETYLTSEALFWSGGESLLPGGLWEELDLVENVPDLSHPFYWAGFTLVGNPW